MHSRLSRSLPLAALVASGALALTGCSASAAQSTSTASGGTINVVASTDVWGDIATQIGGDHVDVTSIITSPDQDPHEYAADAQNQLALSKADVVVENGGGYDDFMGTMLKAADNPDASVLTAATISGYDLTPASGEFNEHVWYDFPTVEKVAASMKTSFTKADPSAAADFAANTKSFTAKLAALEKTEATMAKTDTGKGIAITEPVPLYMLTAIGAVNRTPADFSEAVEEDTDVSPRVLQQTLALFSAGKIDALVYNAQTSGPETTKVLEAAKANDVPVVPVTETLPDGDSYLGWMSENLDAIGSALGR